jgi:hypothetical protein
MNVEGFASDFLRSKMGRGKPGVFEGWQSRANREGMGAYNQDALRGGIKSKDEEKRSLGSEMTLSRGL